MLNKQITICSENFDYKLIASERKTASLSVLPSGAIILKSPNDISEERINEFLKKKYLWLKKQLREVNKYKQATTKKEYICGESFLYLGRQYMLKVHEYQICETITIEKNILNVFSHKSKTDASHSAIILEKWYKEKALNVFKEELRKMSKIFGYTEIPCLVIRKMKKRWGSCTNSDTIILNPELIKATRNCISYVIAHELCHIQYKHHNDNFYNLLSIKFPNWKKTKEKLELRFV